VNRGKDLGEGEATERRAVCHLRCHLATRRPEALGYDLPCRRVVISMRHRSPFAPQLPLGLATLDLLSRLDARPLLGP
jgi:hypothetical protein